MIVPYLIFETEQKALDALLIINNSINNTWAIPELMLNGKYCFPKPDDQYLNLISDYVIEEYSHFWFITEEDFLNTF